MHGYALLLKEMLECHDTLNCPNHSRSPQFHRS